MSAPTPPPPRFRLNKLTLATLKANCRPVQDPAVLAREAIKRAGWRDPEAALLAFGFWGYLPMLRAVADHLVGHGGSKLIVSENFEMIPSKFGFPDGVLSTPVNFHPRVEFLNGHSHPLQSHVRFVMLGLRAPDNVANVVLKSADVGCIVVAHVGHCASSRLATPLLYCGDLFVASL